MSKRKYTQEISLGVTSSLQRKALFIDRDGIINIDHGYVSKRDDFEFSERIFDLLECFMQKDYLLYIVTNQSGIGRGYYKQEDFDRLTRWMLTQMQKRAISIEQVLFCPHAPEAECACRKPKIGMLQGIESDYSIDFSNSWMIGDKSSDIEFAQNAGVDSIYIGKERHAEATYSFESVALCAKYFQEHQGKL